MDFLRQTEVIQWKDGEYKTIKENSVDDADLKLEGVSTDNMGVDTIIYFPQIEG